MSAGNGMRRWPLALIAAPAAVAVWSGWVGLGGLCGFGALAPLPGITGFRINTAITLPVGVEAYGAYALGAWLAPGAPPRARAFARRSAIGALALGMAGQVIYHLLAAAHAVAAPWPVVTLVACLPVATLGMAAALTHLLRVPAPVPALRPVREPPREPVQGDAAAPRAVRDAEPVGRDGPVPLPPYGNGRTGLPGTAVSRTGSDTERVRPPVRAEADRDAIIAGLAGQIRAAAAAGQRWQPDYPALMQRTGFRRSWCEKAVRDARAAASRTTVPVPVPARTETGGTGPAAGGQDGGTRTPGGAGIPDAAPDLEGPARTDRTGLHAVGSTAG
jgi:hypothetical protein